MWLYKQPKPKKPIDQKAFEDFCIELGIWERLPGWKIGTTNNPVHYTNARIKELYKDSLRRKDLAAKKR